MAEEKLAEAQRASAMALPSGQGGLTACILKFCARWQRFVEGGNLPQVKKLRGRDDAAIDVISFGSASKASLISYSITY